MKYNQSFKQGDSVKVIVKFDSSPVYEVGKFVQYLNPFFTRASVKIDSSGETVEASVLDISLANSVLGNF